MGCSATLESGGGWSEECQQASDDGYLSGFPLLGDIDGDGICDAGDLCDGDDASLVPIGGATELGEGEPIDFGSWF